MFEEYLEADGDENDTARDLRRLLEARAEAIAHDDADEREDEGRAADDQRGSHDVDLQKREADADGQRVDARGDGEHEELAQIELMRDRFVLFLALVMEGVPCLLYTSRCV